MKLSELVYLAFEEFNVVVLGYLNEGVGDGRVENMVDRYGVL